MCEIIMGVDLNEFDIATSFLNEGERWNEIFVAGASTTLYKDHIIF